MPIWDSGSEFQRLGEGSVDLVEDADFKIPNTDKEVLRTPGLFLFSKCWGGQRRDLCSSCFLHNSPVPAVSSLQGPLQDVWHNGSIDTEAGVWQWVDWWVSTVRGLCGEIFWVRPSARQWLPLGSGKPGKFHGKFHGNSELFDTLRWWNTMWNTKVLGLR